MIQRSKKTNEEIKYEVFEECGVCSPRPNGDVIKLRYMSWNDGEPKYDLRVWYEEDGKEKCRKGKGFGMVGEELLEIRDLIDELEAKEEEA